MKASFVAESHILINAPLEAVWRALTDPAWVAQYMHGTRLETDWRPGSSIFWRGEWKGTAYEDKGEVLEVTPMKVLKMTHWSPMGGSPDKPENYHTVTYDLASQPGGISLTVRQDNNASQEEADAMAKNNWGSVLEGLKAVVEKQPRSR